MSIQVVLICRNDICDIEITPRSFKMTNFDGLQILSGDKYYIDKAISLGAIKPARKKKAKSDTK